MKTMNKAVFARTRSTRRGLIAAALGGVAAVLLAGMPAHQAHAASEAVQKISDHFSSVKTMMGEFVQFGPRGEQTGGKFFIERPGKLRFNYEPPSEFRVVSDGESVVLENRKLETAELYSLSQTPLKVLLEDRIDLSGDKVKNVKEEDDLTTITLSDKSVFGDSTITMMFDPKSYELRQWTVTDAQGKDTTVMIFNVERGVDFDRSVFNIDYRRVNDMNAPKGTR